MFNDSVSIHPFVKQHGMENIPSRCHVWRHHAAPRDRIRIDNRIPIVYHVCTLTLVPFMNRGMGGIIMDENQRYYDIITKQEAMLQFTTFTADTALEIGLKLADRAKKAGKAIAISIIRNGFTLFVHNMEGTSPDNDLWVAGKNYLVNRFLKSSLFMAKKIRAGQTRQDDRIGIYVAGGAFPVIVKGVGVVGTITVSGLHEDDDHGWTVEILKEMLNQPDCPSLCSQEG